MGRFEIRVPELKKVKNMKNEVWYGIEDITHNILVRGDDRYSRPYLRKRKVIAKREVKRLCVLNPNTRYRVVWFMYHTLYV